MQRDARLHPGDGEEREEERQHDQAEEAVLLELGPDAAVELRRQRGAHLRVGTLRLAEDEEGEDQRAEREAAGDEARQEIAMHAVIDADGRENPAERRPEDEAHAEGGADEAHPLGAVLFSRRVGDVRLRRSDVRAAGAGDHARDEQQREAVRDAEEKVAGAARGETDEQHRAAADPIGEPPPHRREEELHDRVDADDRADRHAAGAVLARIERQERDHHPEADQIDEDRDEEYEERGAAHAFDSLC